MYILKRNTEIFKLVADRKLGRLGLSVHNLIKCIHAASHRIFKGSDISDHNVRYYILGGNNAFNSQILGNGSKLVAVDLCNDLLHLFAQGEI